MVECGAHLFQGRFGCVAMDETHCLNAVRYLVRYGVRYGAIRGHDTHCINFLAR
jgi:hypothetical protein